MVKYVWESKKYWDPITGDTREYRLRRTEDSGRDHVVGMIIYKEAWGTYRANYYRGGTAKNFSKITDAKKWIETEEGVKKEKEWHPFGL